MFDRFHDECGVFGSRATRRPPGWLPRPVRAAAPRPGERRHRLGGRHPPAGVTRHGVRGRRLRRGRARPPRRDAGHRPREVLDRRGEQARQRAAHPHRLRARPDRHLSQRQPGQRDELRESLVRQGSIFQTSSDTEVILHLYARSKAGPVDEALVESLSRSGVPSRSRCSPATRSSPYATPTASARWRSGGSARPGSSVPRRAPST